MEKVINYKSNFSLDFFISILITAGVFGLTATNVFLTRLDIPGFIFLNILSFFITYFFALRFASRITVTDCKLEVRYIFPFKKSISININQVVEVDKHPDVVYRYYKKIFIKTNTDSYLIQYNISDDSDEKLLSILNERVAK